MACLYEAKTTGLPLMIFYFSTYLTTSLLGLIVAMIYGDSRALEIFQKRVSKMHFPREKVLCDSDWNFQFFVIFLIGNRKLLLCKLRARTKLMK